MRTKSNLVRAVLHKDLAIAISHWFEQKPGEQRPSVKIRSSVRHLRPTSGLESMGAGHAHGDNRRQSEP